MKRRGGLRACGAALGWIPLGLALSAMATPPSCITNPALVQLQQQRGMRWNAETDLSIRNQIQLIDPWHTQLGQLGPAYSRRGDNILLDLPSSP